MNELGDLYQRVIIDHNRSPRNHVKLEPCSHHATGHNPLCGDTVELYLRIRNDVVREVGFQGESCAIATASASMLTEAVRGLTPVAARQLAEAVRQLVRDGGAGGQQQALSGDLGVLAVVNRFPGRTKCAELPWKALLAALDTGSGESVSTEDQTTRSDTMGDSA